MKKTRKIISLLLSILMIITTISALSITSAAAYYESEPNDSISTADSISTNATAYGVTNTSGDDDYYKFSLSSQGYITITMNHAQLDSGYWTVSLYDVNGNRMYQWDFNAVYASNSTEKIGLPAGTYYAKIGGYKVEGVDYNFKVNYTQTNYWESESNDSRTKADNISVNTTYYGVSNTGSDDDYYKFSLSSQGYITITMNHAQLDSGYWTVSLYDVNGNRMYQWDFNAAYASNSTEKIGLPAGTYYAKIGGYKVEGVDYNFKVNYTQTNYWESESNDSRTKADNISVNTTYYGVSNTSGDDDYYKFSLSSQGYITITMNHAQLDSGYWTVSLYDVNGNRMYQWDFDATYASNSTEKIGLPAGTYYAKIGGYKVKGVDYSFIVEQPLFPDVRSSDWYFNAVKFNAEKGYVTGYSNGTFGPSNNIQRQDFVLILARIAGADLSAYEGQNGGFSDVQAGAYYASAVAWAKDKGIVTGYSADNFGVGTYITREQISLILCRYLNGSASGNVDTILNAYSDGGNTSPWAKAGVAWAVENGIIGNSDYLNPNGNAGRAEVAQIIYNMSNKGML
jgi:uncharacterized membrane protein